MMSLGGGQLTALGVQFEINLEKDIVSESWTLAEVRPGESVRFDGCTLTIKNSSEAGAAYASDVAFFDIRAVPGPGVMTSSDALPARLPASLQLKNSVVRGEARFARADEPLPIQITWENGLLAITQQLLTVKGAPQRSQAGGADADHSSTRYGPCAGRACPTRVDARRAARSAAGGQREQLHLLRQIGATHRPDGNRRAGRAAAASRLDGGAEFLSGLRLLVANRGAGSQ